MFSAVFGIGKDGTIVLQKTLKRDDLTELIPQFVEKLQQDEEKADRVLEVGGQYAIHLEINDVVLVGFMDSETSVVQGYQGLYYILELLKATVGEVKLMRLAEKVVSLNLILDQLLDGGFFLLPTPHAILPLAQTSLFEKSESEKIGAQQLAIKSQFVNLDKYADTAGV
mgnify:CR=1 FL=1